MDSLGRVGPTPDGDDKESGRARKRDSIFLSAQLTIAGARATYTVRVRNLSAGGLMAEYDAPVEPGTAVLLDMRGLGEMTGRVAWCTHGRIGVALDQPIDPARARKPVGTGKDASGQGKPMVVPGRR